MRRAYSKYMHLEDLDGMIKAIYYSTMIVNEMLLILDK